MMDVQMAPPTYTPVGGARPPVGNPPVLGQQVPGMTGGMPAQGGLSVTSSPMAQSLQSQTPDTQAQQLQSYGRGDDSMLVHMTPDEVNSLQGLALATGGSLTINPQTGLPEAGWLGKLLPTILGAALAATGVGAPLAAGIVGAGQFARTGSLKKGLMAGLGAFGGAGMAGMAGLGGKISSNALGILGDKAGFFGANMGLGAAVPQGLASGVANTAPTLSTTAPSAATTGGVQTVTGAVVDPTISINALGPINPGAATAIQGGGAQFTGGMGSRFGQAVRAGLPSGTPGIISKAAPMLAASGVMQGVSGAMTPSGGGSMGSDGVVDNSYAGPYYTSPRSASYRGQSAAASGDSSENLYFANSMPAVYNTQGQMVQPGSNTVRGTPILQNILNPKAKKGENRYTPTLIPYMGGVDPEEDDSFARGGEVELSDGAFVLDARTVSEIGNGSSNAGMEALRRIGGRPIDGPGDGVSDSIPARIGRDQPARVARDEVLMPADAVRRIGRGNPKKGADKLYALMNKAHKARKKAKRGQDTKVRRGLV
jgi:hypothetical protein